MKMNENFDINNPEEILKRQIAKEIIYLNKLGDPETIENCYLLLGAGFIIIKPVDGEGHVQLINFERFIEATMSDIAGDNLIDISLITMSSQMSQIKQQLNPDASYS